MLKAGFGLHRFRHRASSSGRARRNTAHRGLGMNRSFILALLALASALVSGCGAGNNFFAVPAAPTTTTTTTTVPPTTTTTTTAPAPVIPVIVPTAVNGTAHAGQTPIVGAHVYLYAIGASGYGGPSTSVLDGSVTGNSDANGAYVLTNSAGGFSIVSGAVNCGAGSEAYLLISGGSTGAGPNSAIGLLAPVGACPLAASATSIWVNEVSTVVTAYALSAYASDAFDISSPGSALALTGLANALATVGNLYDNTSGNALATTPGGNGTVPQATINTLANILTSCIGTGGPSSSQCSTLFASTAGSGAAPSDTASAAMNIAHYPANSVSQLFGLQSQSSGTFQPALANSPSSWILPVSYTGGGLSQPAGLAIDAAGNVWAANSNANTLSELSPLGVPANANGFTGGGLDEPFSVAIDQQGNVWTANTYGNSISKFTSGGQPLSPAAGFTGGGLYFPFGMAVDAAGSVWVGNLYDKATSYISHFDGLGTPLAASGILDGVMGEIGDIQLDGVGNLWVTGLDSGSLIRIPTTSTPVPTVYSTGVLTKVQGEAIDAAGKIWVSGASTGTFGEFSSTGQSLGTNVAGGGLKQNRFLAIDGAGNIWTPSYAPGGVVSEFTNAGVPVVANGFVVAPTSSGLWAAAIDGSGNVWVSTQDTNLLELVGAAAPVVTPIVEAATTNRLGVRP